MLSLLSLTHQTPQLSHATSKPLVITRSSCFWCWLPTIGVSRDDRNASRCFHPIGTRNRRLGNVQPYPSATGRRAVREASRSLGIAFDWENDVRHRKKDRSRYTKRRQETGVGIPASRLQPPMIDLQSASTIHATPLVFGRQVQSDPRLSETGRPKTSEFFVKLSPIENHTSIQVATQRTSF